MQIEDTGPEPVGRSASRRSRGRPRLAFSPTPDPGAVCPQLLTIPEAAARLAVKHGTLRLWIRQGRLPAVKVGRCVRIRETDLAAFASHSA